MKAIKGCTNPECKAYKKIHFKKDDQFCPKCGDSLSFVCADCWKAMENDKERYCLSCSALREQKRAQTFDAVKDVGGKAVAGFSVVASVVGVIANNTDKLAKNSKKIINVASDVAKIVKK